MYTTGIETFLTVVRTQNLSKAAEEMHLAQTTVSRRLKMLEQELDLVLIERNKGIKHIRLTPIGEEFFTLAEQWSLLLHEANLLKSHGPKFNLVVGSVDSINSFILPPVYSSINNHPFPIRLQIHTSHSVDLYNDVEKRQVDVAFVLRELVHPNVNVTKCFASPMVLLRLADLTRNRTEFVHPKDLNPSDELYMPWGCEFQSWHEHWWNLLTPSRVKLDSATLLFTLLQKHNQWAIIPKIVADAAATRGIYDIQTLSGSPPYYMCYKVTHKNPTSLTKQALSIFDQYFQQLVHSQ